MKALFFLTIVISVFAFAHSDHHDNMKAGPPLPGMSLYQLQSEWQNQRGETVKLSSLKGSPRLVVMLFTNCETACPLIVEDLKEIAKDIDVSIFSFDSFRETSKTLAEFAEKRRLPARWGLYTAKAGTVAELAAALGVRYKRLKDGDYIHSNVIYLLNEAGEIVAKKDGIKAQSAEFSQKIKDLQK